MESITYEDYQNLLEEMFQVYDLVADAETSYINEMFEGEDPVFKLIFVDRAGVEPNLVLVSFHLDVDPGIAVKWFDRIRQLQKNLALTSSYYKDDNGESYVSEKAEHIKLTKLKQQILDEWSGDKKEAEAFANGRVLGRSRLRERDHGFVDQKEAENEFYVMKIDKTKDVVN